MDLIDSAISFLDLERVPVMQNVCPSRGPVLVSATSSEISNSPLRAETTSMRAARPSKSSLATVSPTLSIETRRDIASLYFKVFPSSSSPGSSSILLTSLRRFSRLPTSDAIELATSGPILGIPRAARKVLRGMLRLASNSSITLPADFSAIRSRLVMSLKDRV